MPRPWPDGATWLERFARAHRLVSWAWPRPVAPPPRPVAPPPPPVFTPDLAMAAIRIAAYAATREIGPPVDNGGGEAVHGWDGMAVRDFAGGAETQGRCIVVDGPRGPALVRNGFYAHYQAGENHKLLGAPLEEERWEGDRVVQRFERGALQWTPAGGVQPLGATVPAPAPAPSPAPAPPPAPAPSPGAGPMALRDYPRPPRDNGRGVHWPPVLDHDAASVDRFVAECRRMNVRWVTFLNAGADVREDTSMLVRKLEEAGIEPVMRFYTPPGEKLDPGEVARAVAHYGALGCRYFQPYNEPNLTGEWGPKEKLDVERFVDMWIAAASAITEGGGLPAITPLAPGGSMDDMAFFEAFMAGLARRGRLDLLDHAWVSLHNYTWNRAVDFAEDSNGFRKFEFLDQVVRRHLGRSLPVIGTEGGAMVGSQEDRRFPAVTPEQHARMTVAGFQAMQAAPDYFFAFTPWILANGAGGGGDRRFENAAWIKADGSRLPVVDAVRAMPEGLRQ